MNKPKEKILLVHLYSNGDCLFATAVAKQIKHDFPDCHLTWAIAGFCKKIIYLNPYVDAVLEVNDVAKNDTTAFRKFRKKVLLEKKSGQWSNVFITQNAGKNLALYDGTIRGMIFRAYPDKVTVPIQPVLVLSTSENENVKKFSEEHLLSSFKNVILWEYAPQSGQSDLDFHFVIKVAERITSITSTCVILTSANSFESTSSVIDASSLTIRENASLTHYCNLLIGCSSGITWLSTSSAAKSLPMLQLLNAQAFFRNAPSEDFSRFGISTDRLIEIFSFDEEVIYNCVKTIIDDGISAAKNRYNEKLPIQFYSTKKIVYNLLVYLQFNSIVRHYRIMYSVYGNHPELIKQFMLGFLTFPFKLIRNTLQKKIFAKHLFE